MKRNLIAATFFCALACTSLFAQDYWKPKKQKSTKELTVKDIKSKEIALDKTISGENADLLKINTPKISIQERLLFHWPANAKKLGYRKQYVLCVSIPTSYSVQWNKKLDDYYWPYLSYHAGLKDNNNNISFKTSIGPELDIVGACNDTDYVYGELWDILPDIMGHYDSRILGAEAGEGGGRWHRSFYSYGCYYHREGDQYSVPGLVETYDYIGRSVEFRYNEDLDNYDDYAIVENDDNDEKETGTNFTLFMADPMSYYTYPTWEYDVDEKAFPIPELLHHQDTVYMFIEGSRDELEMLFNKIDYLTVDNVHLMHRNEDNNWDMQVDSATDKLETLLQLQPTNISTDNLLEISNLTNFIDKKVTDCGFLRSNRFVKILCSSPYFTRIINKNPDPMLSMLWMDDTFAYSTLLLDSIINSRYETEFNQWNAKTHLLWARYCSKHDLYYGFGNNYHNKEEYLILSLNSYLKSAMDGNQEALNELHEMIKKGDLTEKDLTFFFTKKISEKFTFGETKKQCELYEQMYQFAVENFLDDIKSYKKKEPLY